MQETSKTISISSKGTDQKSAPNESKQLKARIQNVEKSYEFAKQKVKLLEEDNSKKETEIKKQGDDIARLKS